MLRSGTLALVGLLMSATAFAQANGKLQIHYMDVGQGDGAVLISPLGEVVLFDDGVLNECGKPIGYLQSLGITKIDYHIASHYHSDHVGCAASILQMFPLQKTAFDRGGSYSTATYSAYVSAVGVKRSTAQKGQTITLDASGPAPVTITFVALNGNGVASSDENDLSLVAVVRFGQFDAEFGGDLSGAGTGIVDPDPNAPCTYAVSPTSQLVAASGSTFSVSVTTTVGCTWTRTANASWLSVPTGSTNGSGSINVTVAPNIGGARNGTAIVAGQAVSVSQVAAATTPGGTCARPSAAPPTATAVCNDGTFSFSQNRQGTCSSHGGVSCWICPGVLCNGLMLPPGDGDLPASFADIESGVSGLVGRVEVYKVHHHGSTSSSNATWLSVVAPKVAIVSVGSANSYGHPTAAAMSRLHNAGVKTYWTTVGNGDTPLAGVDAVTTAGSIIVEVSPAATTFSVRYGTTTDTYSMWTTTAPAPAAAAPFGSFDTPSAGAHVSGEVAVTGWALDDSGVIGVDIYRNALTGEPTQANGLVYLGTATLVSGARPDIASSYPAYPGSTSAGWGYMLLSNMLPNQGNGVFTLFAYVRTTTGENTLLGSRAVALDNGAAVTPFGTIDTPAQGASVSGTVVNWGWALTPQSSVIPTDGSTIGVYVDGALVGRPVYNLFRSDIASLFPGLANTSGAVGYYMLDSTLLSNGVHAISWVVSDNQGHISGIGSRYFTVANPTSGVLPDPTTRR